MIAFEAIRILILFAISFVIALFITPFVFKLLIRFGIKKKNIRSATDAPIFHQFHKDKGETPTMGGVIIWGTVVILALLFFVFGKFFGGFANYFNFISRSETYLPLGYLLFAAIIGLLDDILGVLRIGPKGGGLSIKHKLIMYAIVSAVGAWWFYVRLGWNTLYIPFVGDIVIGWWYIPLFMFVIIASAFSMNETDGLDGLAAGTAFFIFGAFAVVAFVLKRFDLAALNVSILGSLLAFLWYNIYPAKFFMGDTGSMSLGITIGAMAMLTNSVFFLPFFGSILIFESTTVIIQLLSKKIRKKKVFLSTPIHHHFEALGWPETQITMRFWFITAVTTIVGLAIFFIARFI